MQLEKSVLARFESEGQARLAAGELENLGFKTVPVNRISDYGASGGIDGQGAHMTMFSGEYGLPGDGEQANEAAGGEFMVVMAEDGGKAGEAMEIIRNYGGQA